MSKPLAFVIEDDFDAGQIMLEALRLSGYDVHLIQNGREAQQVLAAQVPALVALDLHLPKVDGEQLLAQIRSDNRLKNTRVMLVTADDRMAQRLESAANMVLLKPVSFSQIHRLAERLRPH